jgi:toxin ParE1/3/4
MKFDFHPEALDEYEQAALYYAGLADQLGLRFVDVVEDAIERVLRDPKAYQIMD